MEGELPENTEKVVGLADCADQAEVFCRILLIYLFLYVLVNINILILRAEDVVLICADGATLVFEGKDITALEGVLLKDVLLYLKGAEFKCLPFMDEDTVVFFVLAIKHLPHLHATSLKITIG